MGSRSRRWLNQSGEIRATLTALGAVWFQVRASTCHDEPSQEEVVQALLEPQRAQDRRSASRTRSRKGQRHWR